MMTRITGPYDARSHQAKQFESQSIGETSIHMPDAIGFISHLESVAGHATTKTVFKNTRTNTNQCQLKHGTLSKKNCRRHVNQSNNLQHSFSDEIMRSGSKDKRRPRFDLNASTPSSTPWESLKSSVQPPPPPAAPTSSDEFTKLFLPGTLSSVRPQAKRFGTLLSPLKKRLAIEFVDEYYVDATAPPPKPEFASFSQPGFYPFPQPAGSHYAGGIPINCWPYYTWPGPC